MKFSDDLDDATADLVVAALMLNARLRGPGLRDVLTALAVSARDELDVRRRVESSRREHPPQRADRGGGHRGAWPALLVVFNRAYVEPYGTFVGQVVLAGVLGTFRRASCGCAASPGSPSPSGSSAARPAPGEAGLSSIGSIAAVRRDPVDAGRRDDRRGVLLLVRWPGSSGVDRDADPHRRSPHQPPGDDPERRRTRGTDASAGRARASPTDSRPRPRPAAGTLPAPARTSP